MFQEQRYQIVNIVQGTFNQGDLLIFGDSVGKQCACNSLVFIALSKIKHIRHWNSNDLDITLELGDCLYNKVVEETIGVFRHLDADDLPEHFCLCEKDVTLIKHQLHHGEIDSSGVFITPLLQLIKVHLFPNPLTGFLIFIKDMTLGLILDTLSNRCHLFDSHSRDSNGLSCDNGVSALITFPSLLDLQNYIFSTHCTSTSHTTIYFQIQEVEIQLTEESKLNISNCLKKIKRRKQKQHTYNTSLKEVTRKKYQQDPHFREKFQIYYNRNKEAINQHARNLYNQNPEPARKRAKAAYEKNPEPAIQRSKASYKLNPEPAMQCSKAAYKANPAPIIQRAKDNYKNNPEPAKQRSRNSYQHNSFNIRQNSKLKYCQKKCIQTFFDDLWAGPYYICVICNRSLYRKSVKVFDPENYPELDYHVDTNIASFDGQKYICITCHNKLKKCNLPCQAVANNLHVESLPQHFSDLRSLEKLLVAKRILFQKVVVIHGKGEFPKVKGTICNVPVESESITNILPRHADSNGLLIVKLKRKLQFKGHYKCEPVRPDVVLEFLNYLKENNYLYSDVIVRVDNLTQDLSDFNSEIETTSQQADSSENIEEENTDVNTGEENSFDIDNPQSEFQTNSNNSVLVSNIPYIAEEENLVIAPGEGQTPLSMIRDDHCEELSFPHLFPTGKYGRNYERDIPISATKYFNQRLLNYTQKFASDSEFIFYARAILESLNLKSSMSIAMQIVRSRTLTAGQLNENFDTSVSNFISQDNAFKFMRSIRGSPAYWKNFLMEVLAMVKQLGLPSYFFTLSCADLKWDELIFIIARQNGLDISRDDIANMNYQQRTSILNSNPVLLARHFQYRTQLFFKNILLNGPLGTSQYYAYRVEFQQRGSPHIHGFLWIKDFPHLEANSTEEYLNYLSNTVLTNLPSPSSEPELFHHVKTFQIHRHSRTCWKNKNNHCRFHFGKFFSEKSIVAKPLPDDMDNDERDEKIQWRQSVLDKVKCYIDEHLNPAKANIIDPSEENYIPPKSIDEILVGLDIVKEDYYNALSISKDQDFEIHFKRAPNSCFVNNYFADGLMAWQANIDIQPIFNYYKAVTYMCSYFSKCEQECTIAMMQAVKESLEQQQPYYEQMKKVALAYSTKRECSVQEAVYHCLPELHLRRIFPGVVFANSNLPENRFRMLKKKEDIAELPTDSHDIFKRGDMERYMGRPNTTFKNGRFAILDTFCFVEFLANYDLITKPSDEDDYQPDELPDSFVESNHEESLYPKKIPLMDSKEKLRLRKVRKVVRYFVPRNRDQYPEKYAHHLLMLFYPFRKEDDLMSGNPPTYCAKLNNPLVIDIINENRRKFEPYGDIVEEALLQFVETAQPSYDAAGQVENDETNVEFPFPEEQNDPNETAAAAASSTVIHPLVLPDDEINRKINSLNTQQRLVFDYVFTWARKSVQNKACNNNPIDPFFIFLSGSGGCGKSHLIKTIYHAVSKTFLLRSEDPLKCRVLLLAPTGVAAINIEGTTIHSGLGIHPYKMGSLSDQHRSNLRNKLSEVKLLIIDEISMVSNNLLFQVSKRLSEIFGHPTYKPFGGLSVIACGDFYQLPPVLAKPIYDRSNINVDRPSMTPILRQDLWNKFKYIELTKIMRQNDEQFIRLLNRIRVGEITEEDEAILKSRFISDDEADSLAHVPHLFAENDPVNKHNEEMLSHINETEYLIEASDAIPTDIGISQSKIKSAQERRQQDCGGLARQLKIKVGARVMLTSNIDISDKLINGLIGETFDIKIEFGAVKIIYVKFQCEDAGKKAMQKDSFASRNRCVPILKCEADIKIDKRVATSPVIKRTQFPLALAWACTIHKTQGLTLPEAVFNFTLKKQRTFGPGQLYVGFSRVQSLEGLYLKGKYDRNAIKANEKAAEEYKRLEETSKLIPLPTLPASADSLTFVLSNVRSLRKHIYDIFSDTNLIDADVLCFTETGLLPTHDTSIIGKRKAGFDIIYNTTDQAESSLATLTSPSIEVLHHDKYPGISIVSFKKADFCDFPIKLLLLYRKPSAPYGGILETLRYFAHAEHEIDIIMGDFNINALSPDMQMLTPVFEDYKRINDQSTHLQGSLLDHIYVRCQFLERYNYQCINKCVFYSDHDAVKFSFSRHDVDFELE